MVFTSDPVRLDCQLADPGPPELALQRLVTALVLNPTVFLPAMVPMDEIQLSIEGWQDRYGCFKPRTSLVRS